MPEYRNILPTGYPENNQKRGGSTFRNGGQHGPGSFTEAAKRSGVLDMIKEACILTEKLAWMIIFKFLAGKRKVQQGSGI